MHGGLHEPAPGHLGGAEAGAAACAPRDARPAWDDTVALHAEPRRRALNPDPGQAGARGAAAIMAEAWRKREALQRRMLAAPQGLTPRGHPGSARLTWRQRTEWGLHPGHSQSTQAGASSEDSAGIAQRSSARSRQGVSPEPSQGAALRALNALEARMAGLVGRMGAQLGGLEPCGNAYQGPPGPSSPPRPASPAPADGAAQAAAGRKGAQAEALLTCSAEEEGTGAQAADPGAPAAATAVGTHAGVHETRRAGQPPGSGDHGLRTAAKAEQRQVLGAGASDGAAELRAETAKRSPMQEECAHAGAVRPMPLLCSGCLCSSTGRSMLLGRSLNVSQHESGASGACSSVKACYHVALLFRSSGLWRRRWRRRARQLASPGMRSPAGALKDCLCICCISGLKYMQEKRKT